MPEFRFIPTAVGNATASDRRPFCISVHPHGCGERGGFLGHSPNVVGSSPRLWGTLHTPWGMESGSRFIPTAVGNALQAVAEKNLLSVHPHGCGERYGELGQVKKVLGSSPRLWGTRAHTFGQPFVGRFIPTAVGNALAAKLSCRRSSVHPHGCGERHRNAVNVGIGNGSSPRLWGTLPARGTRPCTRRFIPTAVGNAVCLVGQSPT